MPHKKNDNDLVAIRKNKGTLTVNKPTCVGMCILELSKILIYKLHYNYIRNKYGYNSRLLFANIDRLSQTLIVYKDFSNDK